MIHGNGLSAWCLIHLFFITRNLPANLGHSPLIKIPNPRTVLFYPWVDSSLSRRIKGFAPEALGDESCRELIKMQGNKSMGREISSGASKHRSSNHRSNNSAMYYLFWSLIIFSLGRSVSSFLWFLISYYINANHKLTYLLPFFWFPHHRHHYNRVISRQPLNVCYNGHCPSLPLPTYLIVWGRGDFNLIK